WPPPGLLVAELDGIGAEVDDLARESAAFARCIRIRAAFIRWRWLEQPGMDWCVAAIRLSAGPLRGLVVFGTEERADGCEGRIVDLLARDYGATRALILAAFDALGRAGATTATCDYLNPRGPASRALCRRGFRPS